MKVVGLGAGGHAKAVIEAIQLSGAHEVVGLLDRDPALKGQFVLDVPVLGGDELLPGLKAKGIGGVFIGVGSVGDAAGRVRLYEQAVAQGLEVVVVTHPAAVVSPSASVGAGTVVLARAVINPGASLGVNVIINSGAVVEHDCTIGDHAHIATGACLAGGVRVGDRAHVGVGASVKQGIAIGSGAIVGGGAAVVEDVPAGATVVGVPARPLMKSRRQSALTQGPLGRAS